jgi:transcriptional regulator with XRE-family HTH domain
VPKNNLYVQLGKNLVKIRTRQKLTQSEAAERVGVSFRFYQDMEAGISAPSLPTLVKLARGMKTDFARMLEGCDCIKPEEGSASDREGAV